MYIQYFNTICAYEWRVVLALLRTYQLSLLVETSAWNVCSSRPMSFNFFPGCCLLFQATNDDTACATTLCVRSLACVCVSTLWQLFVYFGTLSYICTVLNRHIKAIILKIRYCIIYVLGTHMLETSVHAIDNCDGFTTIDVVSHQHEREVFNENKISNVYTHRHTPM